MLTLLTAATEGMGVLILIDLLTGGNLAKEALPAFGGFNLFVSSADKTFVLFAAIGILLLRALFTFSFNALDGILNAQLRRRLQEKGLAFVLHGDWEFLRDIRVGQRVNAIGEESTIAAKYLMAMVRAGYYAIASCVFLGMALAVNFELTALMGVMGVPIAFLLQTIFSIQAKLSTRQTQQRQGFIADVAEQLAALFQIKVDGRADSYLQRGVRHQPELTKIEQHISYGLGSLSAINILLPACALFLFYLWARWSGRPLGEAMYLMAGVGILGSRAVIQVNNVIGSLGHLTRLAGSIVAVYQLFTIPQERPRQTIEEKVVGIELQNVTYYYDLERGVKNVGLSIKLGQPLIIKGPSGSGKSTLANLIAGIYQSSTGEVLYEGVSAGRYNSRLWRARIGYVTQDIHLFYGSIRHNLNLADKTVDDRILWECLNQVSAAGFIKKLGGLDASIAEAGRSLSGGEKRRIGIARALLRRPDCFIFDEVTAGLDEINRVALLKTIEELARSFIVVLITHENLRLSSCKEWNLETSVPPLERLATSS